MSQNQKIKTYLLSGRSLTQLQALELFGCGRLAARVHNLRNLGYEIKTTTVSDGFKNFAKYHI